MLVRDMRDVVLVDPHGTGRLFNSKFRRAGYKTIAVLSAWFDGPGGGFFDPHAFDFVYRLTEDESSLQEVIGFLRGHDALCIIPGHETGARLAELLTKELTPDLSNDPSLAIARFDKYVMGETVREAGLMAPRQQVFDSCACALKWIRSELRCAPYVILKPPRGTGTEFVFMLRQEDDLTEYVNTIITQQNSLGLRNTRVLVQEFVPGREFMVDTASFDGKHTYTGISEVEKRLLSPYAPFYTRIRITNLDNTLIRQLVDYSYKVLDALGVRYGASHLEIKSVGSSLFLIECNCRSNGRQFPLLTKTCYGTSQVDSLFDFYTGAQFSSRLPHLRKHASVTFINSELEGYVYGLGDLKNLRLSSMRELSLRVENGDFVAQTTNMFTHLGTITLVDADVSCLRSNESVLEDCIAKVVVRPQSQ